MAEISSVLIANRGEIALRIIRTARALGLRTIAVYSDDDSHAPYVNAADARMHIGPSPAGQSYLVAEKIIEAAKSAGADAIHPGYGFLSENAAFARSVEAAGLIFVGPPADAIDIMGDKAKAKRRMIEAGVPCIPGYEGADQTDQNFIDAAKTIGFPVMVKAAAGGGGKGMRLVSHADDLGNALSLARSEALNAFGSSDLILEKAVQNARHVEIQVFADASGNTLHFGERDCSVQRRHQKVVEEAPCPVMTPELRAKMGTAAVEAARAVDYRGAGTVEFLLDQEGAFYFLEMNTRLQVEHPVTEMVTGADLVALQFAVASGKIIPFKQDEIILNGHAIEVRLYAEDPAQEFLPSTGAISLWRAPSGEGIRVDAGIESGGAVSSFYDPMVAKIIAHGATREEARRKLIRALEKTTLFGPQTNRDFLIDILRNATFAEGEATTSFIGDVYGDEGFAPQAPSDSELAAGAVLHHLTSLATALNDAPMINRELLGWSNLASLESVFHYKIDEAITPVCVRPDTPGRFIVRLNDQQVSVEVEKNSDGEALLIVDNDKWSVAYDAPDEQSIRIALPQRNLILTDIKAGESLDEAGGGGLVTAPMHGLILDLFVEMGTDVKTGDKIAILEAMKMQHEIIAEIDGVVAQVAATKGAQIAAGDLIIEIRGDE